MKKLRITLARLLSGGLLAGLLCAMAPAQAASVLPVALDQMIEKSQVAFEGTCIDNRVERDPVTNMIVTYTTFEVRDVLKGATGPTHTIKQMGGYLPSEGVQWHVSGIPAFAVGKDYVVFLARVSKIGFSSPIGLAQGSFQVRVEGGRRKLSNGRDFKELTAAMAAHLPEQAKARIQDDPAAAEMDLEDFKEIVRNHVKEAQ